MCLDYLSKGIEKDYKGKKFGWKVFEKIEGKLYGAIWRGDKAKRIGVWLNEKTYRDKKNIHKKFIYRGGDHAPYEYGWHVFLTREGARRWKDEEDVIRKVYFSNPVAWGVQSELPVVVAKKIKIDPNNHV